MGSRELIVPRVYVLFFVLPMDNTVEVFVTAKMAGKVQNATFQSMIAEFLIVPAVVDVSKVNVCANRAGAERVAKK